MQQVLRFLYQPSSPLSIAGKVTNRLIVYTVRLYDYFFFFSSLSFIARQRFADMYRFCFEIELINRIRRR